MNTQTEEKQLVTINPAQLIRLLHFRRSGETGGKFRPLRYRIR